MITVNEWLENQFSRLNEDFENGELSIRPSATDCLNFVAEAIESEIYACEHAKDIRNTDYDFFLDCRKKFPVFRLGKILEKVYGDSYVHKLTESYTEHTVGFHIDKYYDSLGPSVIKEIIKSVGFDFEIERDKFNRLTIIVKED